MNKPTVTTILFSTMIVLLLVNCAPRPQKTPDHTDYALAAISGLGEQPVLAQTDPILSATVLIEMQIPNHAEQKVTIQIATGIGSLIDFQGETTIVTHNHWRGVLQDTTLVSFYDAANNLLVTMIGKQYRELILYADPGCQVIRPPKEVTDHLNPARIESEHLLGVGETVELVYRQLPDRKIATIQQAVVKEVVDYKGHTAYKLSSLDGQYVQPGDSGGGVWKDGVLVAVNWMSEQEVSSDSAVQFTGNSYAAIYTDEDR